MATPLSLYAALIDLRTTSTVAAATNAMITQWARGSKKSSAGTIKLGVSFGNAFANGVIAAMGGASYTGAILPYAVRLSINGGSSFVSAAWLKGVTITLSGPNRGILIDTPDVFEQFDFTVQGHITYQGAPISAVLDGSVGTIPVTTDPSNPSGGSTLQSGRYPAGFAGQVGLDSALGLAPSMQTAGNKAIFGFQFLAAADTPNFPNTAINADIWDDTTANGLQTVMRAAAGKFDPSDSAPLGARVNYHVNFPQGIAYCGTVGRIPKIDLQSTLPANTYELDETTHALFDLSQTTISPAIEAMKARVRYDGGASNHGLPDGWGTTGLETIFHGYNPPDSPLLNLMVICGQTGAEGGGVYFYLHDGLLRQMSQVFDVWCMAYDGTAQTLYVGTTYGVFKHTPTTGSLLSVPTWTQVGELAIKVTQLCIPATGVIWALGDDGNGGIAVYQSPAIDSEDNSDLGFGGWSRIAGGTGTIVAMAGGVGNLYYVDSTDPTTLILQQPGAKPMPIPMPSGAGIIGIDYLPTFTGIVVRTTAGSAGLWAVRFESGFSPTALINLNPAGSGSGGLADLSGYVQVNRVQQSGDTTSLNSSSVALVAATDAGCYYTAQKPGSGAIVWKPMNGLSGVTDQNITLISCSPTQVVLGRRFERVYMASASSLWISNSGGVWALDLMAANLDVGPYWRTLAGLLVSNSIGALCSADSNSGLVQQNGALGNGVATPGINNLPKNVARCRTLSPRNDFEYSMAVCDSPAPYYALEIQTLAEITADDSRGAITAAEELDLAMWRSLAEHQINPLTINLTGMSYWSQEAALPQLITGDLLNVTAHDTAYGPDGTPTTVVDWSARGFYVLSYDEVKDGSVMKVSLTVGSSMTLLSDALELLQEIVGGTSLGLARSKRYRRVR